MAAHLSDTEQDMIRRRERLLGPAYRLFYNDPLHIVRGEGVWLYDAAGRRYLDMYNNVPHVGHCHPRVVEALHRQQQTLNTHTRYLHENVLDYAERLTAKLPDDLSISMFSCTGSEANELALRLARTYTGNMGVIVTSFAYHGNTYAIAQISTEDVCPEGRGNGVVTITAPDSYRGYTKADAADHYAAEVAAAAKTLQERGVGVAAMIVDTIFSSEGVVTLPTDYLRKAVDIVHDAGGLFIADEVQPGFGRTGTHFWGFERHDVMPDIVTMGKPMGNGHPLSATVTRREIVEAFADQAHYFNTFGGNPVSCAAGLAVLDVLEEEGLQQNALKVGNYIRDELKKLATRFDLIGDIRGSGFFIGVELVSDRKLKTPAAKQADWIVNDLRKRGVLTSSTGRDENVLKFRPPMVLSQSDADFMLEQLTESLAAV
jgi:4-aminobutyrate aminotransferase-like enzyme